MCQLQHLDHFRLKRSKLGQNLPSVIKNIAQKYLQKNGFFTKLEYDLFFGLKF